MLGKGGRSLRAASCVSCKPCHKHHTGTLVVFRGISVSCASMVWTYLGLDGAEPEYVHRPVAEIRQCALTVMEPIGKTS